MNAFNFCRYFSISDTSVVAMPFKIHTHLFSSVHSLLLYFAFFNSLPALALNITISQPNVPFAPSPLPLSHAESDGEEIIALFQILGRTTIWKSIANITFEGDTYEPEGMVRLGPDRYIVSAGEYTAATVPYNKIINGTDRTTGAGFGHLIVFDGKGGRIADATLTPRGAIEYHNGGIDFDGEYIWVRDFGFNEENECV